MKELIAKNSQEPFYIHRGLIPKHEDQLIVYTQSETDPVNLDNDQDRFMTREKLEIWKRKGRTVYVLTDRFDEDGDLRGIFWAGEMLLPEREDYTEPLDRETYRYTYAVRLYGSAKGEGLSHEFLSECIGDYRSGLTRPGGFWVEVNVLNPRALHMDQKMGLKIVSPPDDKGQIVLAGKVEE